MKKSIVMASTLAVLFCAASVQAAPCPMNADKPCDKRPPCSKMDKRPPMTPEQKAKMEQRRAEFDKKLGLTDEQKAKAKQIREAGFEKMKPVMDAIKAKKEEARAIKENGKLTQEAAKAKLDVIHKDLMELHKKAAEIRKQNMQEFEAILTDKQKKTLEKMKQDGRKEFAKKHKHGAHPMPKKGDKPCPAPAN